MATLLAALDRFLESAAPIRREHLLAPIVDLAAVKLTRAFDAQRRLLLARLATHPSLATVRQDTTVPIDTAVADTTLDLFGEIAVTTAPALAAPIDDLAGQALEAGAAEAIADLGVDASFDLANPRAVDFLTRYGADRVTGLDATTRDELRTLLTDAVANGDSYQTTASAIRATFDGFGQNRARTIAVTESGNAYTAGTLFVGQDLQASGLVMLKRWNSAEDEKVDLDICQGNADQGWVPLDDAFQSGDDRPLGHPNCRCYLSLKRDDSTDTTDDSPDA